MDPVVEIRAVVKRFGEVEAVRGVSTDIGAGRLTGIVGPDGAGKTTLIRMIATLLKPSEGSIRVAGFDVATEARAIYGEIGYMPQHFGLYEDLTVIENLNLYARLRGIRVGVADGVFAQLLEFTRLAPFRERRAGKLSGGMKQKLGLACALMARPRVLLLDEPSAGVDPVSRRDLWRMVQALRDDGIAVVWATAYLDEAEQCDEVLLLNDGLIEFAGAPRQLTDRVAGRSYSIVGVKTDRRRLLVDALDLDSVRDGVIQGDAVRVVLQEGAAADEVRAIAARNGGRLEHVASRFEDAFVDLLGGGPGGHSAIAQQMDTVSTGAEVAVSCRALTKRYGDFVAVDGVTFDVGNGELFGLLGPNGAGKSTVFKMLCGVLQPNSGSARVVGLDLRRAESAAKQQIGYMSQKFALYGLLSVRQNLEFYSGVYGLTGALRRERIDEMIETFELQRFLKELPDTLPLGFRQRLALACALMHRPSVLFLDEPTSGVDPITRREFWSHINGLVRKGVTALVTTHFMDEAEYCDRVAVMYQAKVIALDTPTALKVRVATVQKPDPTLDDAFVGLIEAADRAGRAAA